MTTETKPSNYIYPFNHKNIMEAWKEMLSDYDRCMERSDYTEAENVKSRMTALVSKLAVRAGE